MAGTPFGLRPVKKLDGSPYNGGTMKQRLVTASNKISNLIVKGQIVKGQSDGEVLPATLGASNNSAIQAVVSGIEYIDASGNQQYKDYVAASTAVKASTTPYVYLVPMTPDLVFEIMSASGTNGWDAVGETCQVLTNASASTTTHMSKAKMGTAAASQASYALKIVGVVDQRHVGHTLTAAAGDTTNGTIFEVIVNNYKYGNKIAGT